MTTQTRQNRKRIGKSSWDLFWAAYLLGVLVLASVSLAFIALTDLLHLILK